MGIKYVNNSESTLAVGIAAGASTLTVAAGEGIKFPTIVAASGDYFYATLVDVTGNREVIKVTEHQAGTDVFQVIERAADAIGNGTPTAYAFSAADKVQARLPAAAIMAPDATTATSFHIDSDNTGPRVKNNSGVLEVRNATDAAYASLKAAGLTLTSALAIAGTITGVTDLTASGTLTAASLVLSGTITGVTDLTMSGTLSGVTALTIAGALAGVTTLTMSGALSGLTTLAMTGALSGATDITGSGTIQGNVVTAVTALNGATLALSGAAVVGGTSSIPIDNEATGDKIKARDHGTASDPEVVNIIYGTGTPPAASSVPLGTIFFKYV